MSESETFNKLRRVPMSEMVQKLNDQVLPASVIGLGSVIQEIPELQTDLVRFQMREKLLTECGWTADEFILELEKMTIGRIVNEFNSKQVVYVKELIQRAKVYYPNAIFTPARIDLE